MNNTRWSARMGRMSRVRPLVVVVAIGALPVPATAAEVIADDLIVQGQACVGSACTAGSFPWTYDALRIHGPELRLTIIDESADGTPANDWSLGITDDGTTGASRFFVQDDTNLVPVLQMTVDGSVALGAGAELVAGTVSVGAMGNERRVTRVADAVEDTDAVNLRQFEAFQQQALASVGGDAARLDEQLAGIRERIDDLTKRVDRLARRIE